MTETFASGFWSAPATIKFNSEINMECLKGIFKLSEECGELIQILNKAAIKHIGEHPDGKGPAMPRVIEEISDVYAALDYFCKANSLPAFDIVQRRRMKLKFFEELSLPGLIKDIEEM